MHKILKVLAVSFGSGVLLGAGLRVGEAVTAGRKSADRSSGGGQPPGPRERHEIRAWIAEDLKELLASERELTAEKMESGAARMIRRVENLEERMAKQAGDMLELRDCTLRTEKSLQRLLSGIDRFIQSAQPSHANGVSGTDQPREGLGKEPPEGLAQEED